MNLNWSTNHYEPVETKDGSPSLRWLGHEKQETMHHSGGAYSETQLIYGDPVREVLSSIDKPNFLSLGLGLGYCEILVALEVLKTKKDFRLLTFEADPFLVDCFLKYLKGDSLAQEIRSTYEKLESFFNNQYGYDLDFKKTLISKYENGYWLINGALTPELDFSGTYNCILYDAFSSKTSPYLWEEDFLIKFLNKSASHPCLFSTYASTGALKRALKASGFELIKREGFLNKKESTLAKLN